MTADKQEGEMQAIATALGDLRDSWVLMSMALKDFLADTPSPVRDEVSVLVERQLARIRESERGDFE